MSGIYEHMPFRELSVVIPVYNSALSLPKVAEALLAFVAEQGLRCEIILVNDGSRDASWQRIQEAVAAHSEIRGVNLARNYGQHNALLCGIRLARFDVICTMDDDLQHPVSEIPKLLAPLAEGYEVVYGAPREERHGFWRDAASRVTKIALGGAMGAETARHISAFRVFHTSIRDAFAGYQGSFVSIDVLLTWGASRFCVIPVEHLPRTIGASNYTFRKLAHHALNMITGFTVLPLQVASLMGFAFTAFGGLVLLYVVCRYLLQGSPVPGFPFLASIIAVFSGAQMFALGIIGEYLARIHFRSMQRPPYAMREAVGFDGATKRPGAVS